MATDISPNMNLPVPQVGVEPGPDYASDINSSLTIIDSHTHASGSGVQITPSGLNINSDLTFQSNDAIALRSSRYTAQGSPLAEGTDLGCVYVSGVDLYFNDINGNQIRITQSAAVAGTPGSISNLVSPATASYAPSTGTFIFESGASIPGNGDFASVTLREQVASPNGVTLASPLSLAANYTITMPAAAPASQKFVTMDSSGNLAAPWTTDNSTVEISTNTLRVKPQGITATQIANATITTTQIASATIVTGNIASGTLLQSNMTAGILASTGNRTTYLTGSTQVVPAGITRMFITAAGGGGAGGYGNPSGYGGGGGGGGCLYQGWVVVVPAETLTVTVGAGGLNQVGGSGNPGGSTTVVGSSSGTLVSCDGGGGGTLGQSGSGGSGGSSGGFGFAGGDGVSTITPGTGGAGYGKAGSSGRGMANFGGTGGQTATGAGGGGGGSYGSGGAGGANGTSAAANTGAGGGGGNGTDRSGGDGGSGIVIIDIA